MDKRELGPRSLTFRLAILVSGMALLALGVAGLALPIVPGWALIFAGLAVLAQEFAWARKLLDRAKARWHRLRGKPEDSGERPADEEAA